MDINRNSIRLIQQCPVCNKKYQENKVQILDEQGNAFLAYLTCSFCRSNIIVRVVSLPQGLVGSAILTDLNPDEVIEFSERQSIVSDDVLYTHQLLINNEFIQLINN